MAAGPPTPRPSPSPPAIPRSPPTIAQGQFWTLNVTYTDPSNSANDFSGPLTFQLLSNSNLTPNTSSMIEQFTNDGYYNNTGKFITRVATGFPGATNYVIQGGAPNSNGTGSSGQPGTPFPNENVQQLAFTGTDQLAMANAGVTTTDQRYPVLHHDGLAELGARLQLHHLRTDGLGPEHARRNSRRSRSPRIRISAEKTRSPSTHRSIPPRCQRPIPTAWSLLDTTQATAGETSTITVTATDPTDGTTTIAVVPGHRRGLRGAHDLEPDFHDQFQAVRQSDHGLDERKYSRRRSRWPDQGTYPVSGSNHALTYSLVSQPADGTVSNFNPSTGHPHLHAQGRVSREPIHSSTQVTIVRPEYRRTARDEQCRYGHDHGRPGCAGQYGSRPRRRHDPHRHAAASRSNHGTNYIDVIQVPSTSTSTTPVIQVFVNNQLDVTQPAVSSIDDIIVFGSKASDVITIDPT